MKRMSKYTLLCLLLAAAFVFGSMTGMNAILRMRERHRLEEHGMVAVKSPVLAWQTPSAKEKAAGEEEEADVPDEEEERSLSVEQIEKVIRYRTYCEGEILHEPAAGQIGMEEAIAAGEDWLVEMGFLEGAEGETETAKDRTALYRRATLGVKTDLKKLEVPMESWYSFWTVRFSNEYLYADLSVNAVTGKVWDAVISLYRDIDSIECGPSPEQLELFVRLAGVQGEVEKFAQTNESGSLVYIAVKGSGLYAMQGYYAKVVSTGNDFAENYDGDEGAPRYGEKVIDYHLIVE